MNKTESLALFKVSLVIAILIFVTAILSDFSVRMYYGSTDPFIQVLTSLFAIIVIASVILISLLLMPDIRKAILRMFGIAEEER